jgi:hypothetical protein
VDAVTGSKVVGPGASTGTYLVLAALNRVVDPCSRLGFANWWKTTAADRFTKINTAVLDHAARALGLRLRCRDLPSPVSFAHGHDRPRCNGHPSRFSVAAGLCLQLFLTFLLLLVAGQPGPPLRIRKLMKGTSARHPAAT